MTLNHSLELVNGELELIGKKKQTLDNLFTSGKISQSTFDYIDKDLSEALIEFETYRKTVADKITARASELETQLKSLEMSIANLEIHFVAKEVSEEQYNSQKEAITLGLESTKLELSDVKEGLGKLLSGTDPFIPSPSPEESDPTEVAPEETSEDPVNQDLVIEAIDEHKEENVEELETLEYQINETDPVQDQQW